MRRQPEPEAMDLPEEAQAYAMADFSEVNEAFVARLIELASGSQPLRVLDVGTGPGDIPLRLAGRCPDWHITGVDVSPAMLELARQAQDAQLVNVEFVCVDAKAMPFEPHSFDVVFSNSILHHINDTERLWSEIRRLTKPNGLVFLRDLARPESEAAAAAIVRQYAGTESALLQEEYYRSLLAAYSVDEVRQQVMAAGLGALNVAMVTDRHLDIWGRMDAAVKESV